MSFPPFNPFSKILTFTGRKSGLIRQTLGCSFQVAANPATLQPYERALRDENWYRLPSGCCTWPHIYLSKVIFSSELLAYIIRPTVFPLKVWFWEGRGCSFTLGLYLETSCWMSWKWLQTDLHHGEFAPWSLKSLCSCKPNFSNLLHPCHRLTFKNLWLFKKIHLGTVLAFLIVQVLILNVNLFSSI